MTKTKSSNQVIHLFLMGLLAIGILIIKAYVRLPLNQRGASGQGLYPFLNNIQFIETAITTFICVGLFSQMVLKRTVGTSWVFALGFTAINLGVMMIDARMQKYNVFVEQYILKNYGGKLWIYFLTVIILIGGVLLIRFANKRK